MKDRRNTGQERCRTGLMWDRSDAGQGDAGQVEYRRGDMLDRWNMRQVGCRTAGMQDSWDAGKVRCRKGKMQDR